MDKMNGYVNSLNRKWPFMSIIHENHNHITHIAGKALNVEHPDYPNKKEQRSLKLNIVI